MHYTDRQTEKIFAHLDAIVAYINENIMPNIPEYESVLAEFVSEKYRCQMRVSYYDIVGYVGASCLHFEKGEKKIWADCAYKHVDWAAHFVLNWKEIKEQLNNNVDVLNAKYSDVAYAIDNFTV